MSTPTAVEFMGISKPSQAIRAMIAGLREMDEAEDFVVDMGTFGHSYADLGGSEKCYGCAATCTLQKLLGERFSPSIIGHQVGRLAVAAGLRGTTPYRVLEFERAMDCARKGIHAPLFRFFGFHASHGEGFELLSMGTSNWKRQIGKAERIAAAMEAAGY